LIESIVSTYQFTVLQHSEPYGKMGRMHVLYSFSLVEMAILVGFDCLEPHE